MTADDIWVESSEGLVTEISTWSANGYPMPDGTNGREHARNAQCHYSDGEMVKWEFFHKGRKYIVFND